MTDGDQGDEISLSAPAAAPLPPVSSLSKALKVVAIIGVTVVVGFTIWGTCYLVWILTRLSQMDFSNW